MKHVAEQGPGKFSGEPCYAAHFYDAMLDGMGEESIYDGEILYDVFKIVLEDVVLFPCCLTEQDLGKNVMVRESSEGFVYTEVMTDTELQEFKERCEAAHLTYLYRTVPYMKPFSTVLEVHDADD